MRLHPTALLSVAGAVVLCGCAATGSSHAIRTARVPVAAHAGPPLPVSIGVFENHSDFMRGVFADDVDPLGHQARTSLAAQLAETNRFVVLDRDPGDATAREAGLQHKAQALIGADFVVTGDVTRFGRKDVGNMPLFGLFGQSRSQSAYAVVTLNVVDSLTSKVVYSATGTGEVALTSRDVRGFGSTAGYDSTLNGKVLDLAMGEAVASLVAGEHAGRWGSGAHP